MLAHILESWLKAVHRKGNFSVSYPSLYDKRQDTLLLMNIYRERGL